MPQCGALIGFLAERSIRTHVSRATAGNAVRRRRPRSAWHQKHGETRKPKRSGRSETMNGFDRRDFLKLAGAAGIASLPGAIPTAWAADASMLEAAKAQGKTVFYANITAVEPIMAAFEAATGIVGEYTRISSSKYIPTVLTEAGAGKLLADVL